MSNKTLQETVLRWYQRIGFPSMYDSPLEKALETADLTGISMKNGAADLQTRGDYMLNLIYYLYRCEALAEAYRKRGIPEEILVDTVRDIAVWTGNSLTEHGVTGLVNCEWIEASMDMTMFKLGRLQCQMIHAEEDIPAFGVKQGEPLINLHIRQGEPFSGEICKASLAMAEEFFPKYFPEHDFRFFVCHSWLLDKTLAQFVKPDSHILEFQSLFTILDQSDTYSALRYVYSLLDLPKDLSTLPRNSSMQAKMADYLISGGMLHAGLGIRPASVQRFSTFRAALCDESYKLTVTAEGKPLLPDMQCAAMTLPCAKGGEAAFGVVLTDVHSFMARLNGVCAFNKNGIGKAVRVAVAAPWPVELQPAQLMPDDDGCLRSDPILNRDYMAGDAHTPMLLEARIQLPEDIAPGDYAVTVRFFESTVCSDETALPETLTVTLHVYDVAMPKERTFVLDLWQHSSNIARKHDVQLWSDEHFAVLDQYAESLAKLGQKCITVVGSEIPWRGQQCHLRKEADLYEYAMIRTVRHADGTFEYDYSPMRRYIDICMAHGIDREIEVFGIGGVWKDEAAGLVKQAPDHPDNSLLRYYDEATGTYRFMRTAAEIDAYFVALMTYFRREGLESKVRIAADEPGDADAYRRSVAHLRKLWPEVRFKTAINHVEFIDEFHEVIDVFSPYISCVDKNWDALQGCFKRYPDKTFLWYLCCSPNNLNTFVRSPLLESRYVGILTAFMGFHGFLRWNYTVWPDHPRDDIRYGNFSAGDTNFVYPAYNGSVLLSQRYQLLKRGIEDFELITAARKAGLDDAVEEAFKQVVIERDIREFHINDDPAHIRPSEELLSLDVADYHRARAILLRALEKASK